MIEISSTTLTCSHDGCSCQVQIVVPCACSGENEYRCHCGAPLVASA